MKKLIDIPEKIKEAVNQNKLIMFVGAGVSLPLGLPSWKGLVKAFLEEISKENEDVLQYVPVMDKNLFSEIDILNQIKNEKKSIYKVMDKIINHPSLIQNDLNIHRQIGTLSNKIITTNYDKALEEANKNHKKITCDNIYGIATIHQTEKYIFKLHGCIENPENCILFEEDYEKMYKEENAAVETFKSLIKDHTILFLGFSLSDRYINKQFEYIQRLYKGYVGEHYILTTESFDEKALGVKPIHIEKWDYLSEYLMKMLEYKNEINSNEPLLLNAKNNSKAVTETAKVAFFLSNPLDRNEDVDLEYVFKKMQKFDIEVSTYHLSIESLRTMEQFDYIFIFSKIIKNKIVIEDEFLKTELCGLLDIEENIDQENLKGIFIFVNKEFELNKQEVLQFKFPILLRKNNEINDFIFNTFQKRKLIESDEHQIFNKESFDLTGFRKGKIKFDNSRKKNYISESIDSKNLVNFVGRKTDMEDVTWKILNLKSQILTIKGSGGIGKTTLIKNISNEFNKRSYFYDGIYFIDCESVTDFESFEYRVTQCFKIDSSIDFKEHIFKNETKREMMVILDNFETMIYINDTNRVKELVSFICDYCTVIITSREWVGFEFEQKHELRSFTNQEAYELFGKYYPVPKNHEDIKILKEDILSKMLNNNPLAIKIITRNLPKSKKMNELLKELKEDFFGITQLENTNLFDGPADKNIERSDSLYQSISYSYKKLKPKEKLLFEILSLFPEGIPMMNLKNFFSSNDFKRDLNKITDIEITSLDNKSLVEINKGFIKLQSILLRYAEKEFFKRSSEEKKEYYKRGFEFNYFLIMSMNSRKISMTSKIFDKNFENFLKCFDYIEQLEIDKKIIMDFIVKSLYFFQSVEQTVQVGEKLERLIPYFKDVKNAELLLKCMMIELDYYRGEFDSAYTKLQRILPIEELYQLNPSEFIQARIIGTSISVYRYKNNYELRKFYVKADYYGSGHGFQSMFMTGEYKRSKNLFLNEDFEEIEEKGALNYFEILLNNNEFDIEKVDFYLNSLYEKQYIELMQMNYVKIKFLCENSIKTNKREIEKLVVTNLYTKGLKNLMLALVESDFEEAKKYYLHAISDLAHIEYYCLEATYYYAKFLKEHKDIEFEYYIENGKRSATNNQYRFLIHQFICLENDKKTSYDEDLYTISKEIEFPENIENSFFSDKLFVS